MPTSRTFLDSDLPLGVLTDILAHALGLAPEGKQSLLAERHVDRRVDELLDILRQAAARDRADRGHELGISPRRSAPIRAVFSWIAHAWEPANTDPPRPLPLQGGE